MKVAAVQFSPKLGNRESNIKAMAELLYKAVQANAKLVVFPELATTGYSFMSPEEAEPLAEVVHDCQGSVGIMLALSKKLHVGIAWGLITRDPGTKDLYNSQVMVLPDGTLATYAKVNPWANDFLWATPGRSSPPILDFQGQKVGLLICRDVKDKAPNIEDFYEPGDASIVAFSANFGDGGFPATSWMKFATSNKTWMVVSNRYGKEANNNFGEGGVCVISPKGKVFCEGLKWNEPCIVYAETSRASKQRDGSNEHPADIGG